MTTTTQLPHIEDHDLLSLVVDGLTLDELDAIGQMCEMPGDWWPVLSGNGTIASVRSTGDYDYQRGEILNRGFPVGWEGEVVDGSSTFVRSRADLDDDDEDVGVDMEADYRQRGRAYRSEHRLVESLKARIAKIAFWEGDEA